MTKTGYFIPESTRDWLLAYLGRQPLVDVGELWNAITALRRISMKVRHVPSPTPLHVVVTGDTEDGTTDRDAK